MRFAKTPANRLESGDGEAGLYKVPSCFRMLKVRVTKGATAMNLRDTIRDIPDFPKEGILFKDITTLLKDPAAFKQSLDEMADVVRGQQIDAVVGMESRG